VFGVRYCQNAREQACSSSVLSGGASAGAALRGSEGLVSIGKTGAAQPGSAVRAAVLSSLASGDRW
jgi:hypothetical protein